MVLGDIIKRNAKRYPKKAALVFQNTRLTFSQLNTRVNSLANALLNLGVSKGDRVAVLLDNCPQFVELYCAAAKGGMVLVPLNYMLSGQELTYIINNAEANTLFFGDNYSATVDSIRGELKSVKNFVAVRAGQQGLPNYNQLISQYPSDEPGVEVNEDDLVYLLYTSGTTGLPKGVMLSHRTALEAALNCVIEYPITHRDIGLTFMPVFWGAVVVSGVLAHFYVGSTIVLLKQFEPEAVLKAIEEEKITSVLTVPAQIISLLQYPELNRYDIRSLSRMCFSGAPMPVDVLKRAVTAFGNIFTQVYALVEEMPLTFLGSEDMVIEGPPEKLKKLASCGREVINVEVRVVDENGNDVAPGDIGEIIARGDNMMRGYWRLPQATQEIIRGGYLYTGDLATIDEAGYLYLVGRKKDIITSGGKTIYPAEVEEALYRHPSVLEAAVVGIPDEKLGEVLVATIVLKESKKATAEEIIQFCRQNLASYAIPKSVIFTDKLPRTPSGKLLRRVLREKYQSGT